MTSTLLQGNSAATTAATGTTATNMGWSHDKLRFSCVDNISFRQLWKLMALDATTETTTTTIKTKTSTKPNQMKGLKFNNKNNNTNNCKKQEKFSYDTYETFHNLLGQRDMDTPLSQTRTSLLKFLAINALELSAPATPALLQQKQLEQQQTLKPTGWLQLSGHPESIVPTSIGVVHKRVASLKDYEVLAYQQLTKETQAAKIIPAFYGTLAPNPHEFFIELQDLLTGFKDPCVMDIKMGCRTFLETEVNNKTLRPDLYQKMLQLDTAALTDAEHQAQAITKLRYMTYREAMSSSMSKGFRIEALRLRGKAPIKDLKMIRSAEHIHQTIKQFIGNHSNTLKELIKRLKQMREIIEHSPFFQGHEIVGSSIFIVYDEDKIGCWLIDFAKSRPLPSNCQVNHRSAWLPGNHEEGLLLGFDNLIQSLEAVYNARSTNRIFSSKCLQI